MIKRFRFIGRRSKPKTGPVGLVCPHCQKVIVRPAAKTGWVWFGRLRRPKATLAKVARLPKDKIKSRLGSSKSAESDFDYSLKTSYLKQAQQSKQGPNHIEEADSYRRCWRRSNLKKIQPADQIRRDIRTVLGTSQFRQSASTKRVFVSADQTAEVWYLRLLCQAKNQGKSGGFRLLLVRQLQSGSTLLILTWLEFRVDLDKQHADKRYFKQLKKLKNHLRSGNQVDQLL